VIELRGLPGLKKKLNTVLAGSVVQNFKPTQAKDVLYELEPCTGNSTTASASAIVTKESEIRPAPTGNFAGSPF
jgi:hypothetical protein